uniref:Uncharacterized protein n=1 Tax=uncultured microorganism TaxID=358574 RepID=I2FJK1_9ZZZZ|nr:hypothetical protein [uncultured microorganism]
MKTNHIRLMFIDIFRDPVQFLLPLLLSIDIFEFIEGIGWRNEVKQVECSYFYLKMAIC